MKYNSFAHFCDQFKKINMWRYQQSSEPFRKFTQYK